MPELTQDSLAARCKLFVEATAEGIDWVSGLDNDEVGPSKKAALSANMRRAVRRGTKLGAAAASNMAVSVFGPSQNGKSFMVSVLARPEGRPLFSAFSEPAGEIDYVRDINPEGGGESTGLVTRFTMIRPKTIDGYPVPLRMLSLADVAQLLANSFFLDGDKSEPEPDSAFIGAHLARFGGRTGRSNGGISADDIREIADYIDRNFRIFGYASALRSFWDEAADIAPLLDLADLGEFLSPLWGGYAEFTGLFDTLARALSDIGFAAEVNAPLSALVPRETSILDVVQLQRIDQPGSDLLELALPQGRRVRLPRPVVCALTAELVLPMRDLPDEMFRQTDLLDFPGTRNRFAQPLRTTFVDSKGGLGQLLLRGKVAYLFDRYVDDQKINAMLLCIKDSNMEQIDLPKQIENWISLTHGATPERRMQTACILFFCLTFFDRHLTDSAAAEGATSRFEKRIFQSITEKFGSSNWVRNWTPGKQFQNTFWLRNPNYYVEALFDLDRNTHPPRETLKPEKAARMAELRAGCLAAPGVQRHFADPAAAWDAAMIENDGGFSYLKAHLKPVCSIARKLEQIGAQLLALEEEVLAGIESFYISDDLEERRQEKHDAANRLIDGLENTLEARSFGSLIGAMMVDQDTLHDRMMRVPAAVRISNTGPGDGGGDVSAGRPGSLRPRNQLARTPDEAGSAQRTGVRTMTRPAFQADVAMLAWNETLDRLKQDPRLTQEFGLSSELAASMVGEILHASRRIGLEARIRHTLEEISFGLTLDGLARPASILACETINRFVSTLDYDRVPEAQRPQVEADDGNAAVFAAKPVRGDVLDLPERPRAALPLYWRDWVHCVYELYMANANHVAGANFDQQRNATLKDILRRLQREDAGP